MPTGQTWPLSDLARKTASRWMPGDRRQTDIMNSIVVVLRASALRPDGPRSAGRSQPQLDGHFFATWCGFRPVGHAPLLSSVR